MCIKCFAVSHTQHKCGEIKQIADEFSKHIDVDIKQVRQRIYEFNYLLADAEACAAIIYTAAEKVENEIIENCEKMKQLIDMQMQQLKQEVRSLQAVAMKDIDAKKDSLQLALVAMESYTEYATALKSKGSYNDVTVCAEKLRDRAGELLQTYSKAKKSDECCAAFVAFTPSHVVEELVQTGENIIGNIGCNTPAVAGILVLKINL